MSDSPITPSEILDIVKQLLPKKSEDMYGYSMFFIKKFLPSILTPLHLIFSLSFKTGVVPSQLKIAKVVPIHKGGDRTSPNNFRPISLLPCVSKILEKLIANRLTLFLESNNIISPSQFGFRKNHSTIHPLLHFMNHLTRASNKKLYTIAIFCDLQKAFDTVNHKILLQKLESVGVRGVELAWFTNYLEGRKQFVFFDECASSLNTIEIGVPQGSILGPLLFLIYINDLSHYSSLIDLLFADDTTLLKSHANLGELVEIVNTEFRKIVTFFKSHRLSLHPDKTKFMLFTNSGITVYPSIFINFNDVDSPNQNEKIVPMSCINSLPSPVFKFLGVYFDPNLNFKYHISQINNKLSKSLYFLRSVKNFLNQKALKLIYFATFHSNLIYAIHIWSSVPESTYKQLYIKQKAAIRIICNSKYNAHSEPLFKELNILPLPFLVTFFKIQFMQRFVQGFLPISFENLWITNRIRRQDESEIQLRDDDLLYIPPPRTNSTSFHPLTLFPTLWRDFPDDSIKFIRNIPEFNLKLKLHFLNTLHSTVICNLIYCPACSTS